MSKSGTPIPIGTQKLIVCTGARGSGKTTFAATYEDPINLPKVVYADSEKSANRFREQLSLAGLPDFGLYIDLEDVERRFGFPKENDLLDRLSKGEMPWANAGEQGAMLGYYTYILDQLSKIPYGKYDTFVLDVAEKFEYGMRAWCEVQVKKLAMSKDHGKMENALVRPLYESFLNALWGRGIQTIILNFHLRNVWDKATQKPVANKVQMSGNVVLYKRASLMLWLVADGRNPNGEPAGLVIKERMESVGVKDGKWNIRRVIPPRIPVCTWEEIRRYEKDGYNIGAPKETEVLSKGEQDMISEMYNDAQMALMLKDLELEQQKATLALQELGLLPTNVPQKEESIVAETPKTKADAIKMLRERGLGMKEILERLKGFDDGDVEAKWGELTK